MNLHNSIAANMQYIQRVFLGVQEYMQQNHEPEALIDFLDTEPPAYRSVAYESASMEMGFQELSGKNELTNWKKFYQHSATAHTFHISIGLGWAFAKTGINPAPYLASRQAVINQMVFDGIGYYYGLFKGRNTVKQQIVPPGIEKDHLTGFDQGLGRRLWYICKGDVIELNKLLQPYHKSRLADLWRGVGIACNYVGGAGKEILEQLLVSSAGFEQDFATGVALAAMSRFASNSVTKETELACAIVCGKPLKALVDREKGINSHFYNPIPLIK